MNSISIAVGLRAPDPAASTALATMKRVSPGNAPAALHRFDCWQFAGMECTEETVQGIVEHFDDIVNPNKQTWSFIPRNGLPPAAGEFTWAGVLVTDREDSVSENWTAILRRRDFPVEKVVHSVLWMLGFQNPSTQGDLDSTVLELAVTSRRDGGLLANPVSQIVHLLHGVPSSSPR